MSRKFICFRFDVDTIVCGKKGVSNLARLGVRYKVNFTFFYNMGRSVFLPASLSKFKTKPMSESAAKLSVLSKLGITGFCTSLLLNPRVGVTYSKDLRQAQLLGHEIGLHGGRNHGTWMANALHWSESKLREEVHWGVSQLKKCGIVHPDSFSSPCWKSHKKLPEILLEEGFTVLADLHGYYNEKVQQHSFNNKTLFNVPTNLLGEPGGVGYFEHMRALKCNNKSTIDQFVSELEKIEQLAVLYDHPVFAGIQALSLVGDCIRVARDKGFECITFKQIPGKLGLV